MHDGKMLDDVETPSSLLIHTDREAMTIILRMKRWLPAQTRMIIGRVLLLWSFIIGGALVSYGSAFWMVAWQWIAPGDGSYIGSLSWIILSIIACLVCLFAWI